MSAYTWMSVTNPMQTRRAWFWGTHKRATSAALLGGRVGRTAGNVLVFGPPLHRGIELRSLHTSDFNVGTIVVVTQLDALRYRVSARTGWPGVRIL